MKVQNYFFSLSPAPSRLFNFFFIQLFVASTTSPSIFQQIGINFIQNEDRLFIILLNPIQSNLNQVYDHITEKISVSMNRNTEECIQKGRNDIPYLTPPSLVPGLLVLQMLHFVRFAQLMFPHLNHQFMKVMEA